MISIAVFTFNPFAENTYVLFNEAKEAIIIDPGCYAPEEKKTLQSYIESNGLKPVQLLNTHCHLDHVFGNKWVYQTFGLEVFLHPNEAQILSLSEMSARYYDLSIDAYKGPLHFLNNKDIITLGSEELQVLLTPGHSPGSICFYSIAQKFIIGGDVLFKQSIGRTDLPGGNHEALIAGITAQLFALPDDVTVFAGHGPSTTIGHEKQHNPYLASYRAGQS